MRIGFVDFISWDYTAETVRRAPLGGSQSALVYLARELAAIGHDIVLINRTTTPGRFEGIEHVHHDDNISQIVPPLKLDALVAVQLADHGKRLKAAIGDRAKLVMWLTDAAGTRAARALLDPAQIQSYDSIVCVSQWHLNEYKSAFPIDPSRARVFLNGFAPGFANLFGGGDVLPHKVWPPILTYFSGPDRGLDLLLDLFPAIRAQIPGSRLQVFSGMKLYRVMDDQDTAQMHALYKRCRDTQGVEYIGPLPQSELAERLKSVSLLTYPTQFLETSCIVAMEAMAAGCTVVTTDRGALPETTAGFGRIVPYDLPREEFSRRFVEQVVAALRQREESPAECEAMLRRQVDFVNENYTWPKRARQWADWLAELPARPARWSTAALDAADRDLQSARHLLAAGQVEQAAELCTGVLTEQPQLADALYLLGTCEQRAGQYAGAESLFRQAVDVDHWAPAYPAALGLTLAAGGKPDDGIEWLCRAIDMQPIFPEAFNNLGTILFNMGKFDEAFASFRKAIAQRPDYAEAHNNLGNALLSKGDLPGAIAAFESALAAKPDYSMAQRNLAIARQRAGHQDSSRGA
jgi:protein O-GlcNAc transferase